MNVHTLFIDMNGTLLKTSNNTSRRNMEAIYRLMNQGVKVFTGKRRQKQRSNLTL